LSKIILYYADMVCLIFEQLYTIIMDRHEFVYLSFEFIIKILVLLSPLNIQSYSWPQIVVLTDITSILILSITKRLYFRIRIRFSS